MYTNKLELSYSTELHNYDIFPKVVPAGKATEITVKPLGAHAAFAASSYTLSVHPMDEGAAVHYPDRPNNFSYAVSPGADGCIRFSFAFFGEQPYIVKIVDGAKFLLKLYVYSVFDDLAGRYPFRGDTHLHSFRSDGRQSPAIVAADYRKTGYDFLALTDHCRYYPSLEAIAAYEDVPIEMALVPGEEVHLPMDREGKRINDIHIINFGGNYSINGLIRESFQCTETGEDPARRAIISNPPPVKGQREHWDEVEESITALNIPEDALKGSERFQYADCRWIFDHIKRGNGLGIFCHPDWIVREGNFQVPPTFYDYMMETRPFGAYEVLGGEHYFEQNGFQSLSYFEDRAKGRRYPVVGGSDSHSVVNNRDSHVCSTMVFAPENEKRALIQSIKDFYSVAVDTIDETVRYVGELRLVRYACFLEKNFFPLHDELCFEEGRAMRDYVCGVPGAKETLEFISGRMRRLREKYFSWPAAGQS